MIRVRALLSCFVLFCLLAPAAGAATFTPTTTVDGDNGACTATKCTLRDAVTAASAADGNTVVIPAGRYELNQPDRIDDLDLSADMTIQGAGARATIVDANSLSRVFHVTNVQSEVSISGLTVTGGLSSPSELPGELNNFDGDGGGILNLGPLTLTDVTVTNNRASLGGGGILSEPVELFLSQSAPPLTLVRTTVSNNTVSGGAPGDGQGGGIAAFGDLTATNTTIHGNSVSKTGLNQGGGIVSSNGLTKLTNTTVTGNSIASPAGLAGGLTLYDVGASPFSGDLEARNTIVAQNTIAGAEGNCSLSNTTVTDNNISGDDSCGFTDPGSKENTDPALFPLRDNAGPTNTRNFPLSSPALDAGAAANCPATDQRGQLRPQRGGCDIGAVELAPPSAVTTGSNAVGTTSAQVLGRATNPLIAGASAFFELGTTTAYGTTVPSSGAARLRQAAAAGYVAPQASENESATVAGLAPSTSYHFRLVVQNADGIARGADASFATLAQAAPVQRRRPRVAVAGVGRSCARRAFNLKVRVSVASGTRLKAVRVTLDGRTLRRTTQRRFSVRVPAAGLRYGRHVLRVKAVDRGNRTRTVTRRFSRCARVPVARPRFTG